MQVDVLAILLKEGVNDCEMDVGLPMLFAVDVSYTSLQALLVGPSARERRNIEMGRAYFVTKRIFGPSCILTACPLVICDTKVRDMQICR